MTTATKPAKQVHIVARFEFKSDPRKVCYHVHSSGGQAQYTTCLFEGKACSCTCPARKPCYHMTQLEAHEAERNAPKSVQNPSTVATNMVLEAKRRQEAPLHRAGFSMSR